MPDRQGLHTVIVKVAGACNLNCTYCYVYNKGDVTWRSRPRIMSEPTFEATLDRIRSHCQASGQDTVQITFHGGEPCLIGPRVFDAWCQRATSVIGPMVRFTLQTNGTLLDERWAAVLERHRVQVGVSIDGPPILHDRHRVDLKGRGSYERVRRGLAVLQEARVPFGILCVIPLGEEPLAVHKHFIEMGCDSINYILPDFTHDTISEVFEKYGPTPCSDFLIPIFEHWWNSNIDEISVGIFWHIAWIVMGGVSRADSLGGGPLGFLVVETDGEIEGLDCLRVCRNGITKTGLNVRSSEFRDLATTHDLNAQAIFHGIQRPTLCASCPEGDTCGGGYLPHRYSKERGFDNPSVWCRDLLRLFSLIRQRLGVTVEETGLRRQVVGQLEDEARSSLVHAGQHL